MGRSDRSCWYERGKYSSRSPSVWTPRASNSFTLVGPTPSMVERALSNTETSLFFSSAIGIKSYFSGSSLFFLPTGLANQLHKTAGTNLLGFHAAAAAGHFHQHLLILSAN